MMQMDERRIAVFIDFENVAMGVRESQYGNFDIELVLKRLVEKGKIMVKRAYSDWHRYTEFKRAFHQSAIELIDVPQNRYSGKNSADIRMVVDALDLAYQRDHIDTFVLVSGDSDFSPLVSKLRENGRYVIGMGVKQSSSDLLINNCDEFIFYEDLVRPSTGSPTLAPKLSHLPRKQAEALRLILETVQALQREGKEVIYGSMIKQTLVRKLPSFNETYFGYPSFSRLLEDAANNQLLNLTKDPKSGGYVITVVGESETVDSSTTSNIVTLETSDNEIPTDSAKNDSISLKTRPYRSHPSEAKNKVTPNNPPSEIKAVNETTTADGSNPANKLEETPAKTIPEKKVIHRPRRRYSSKTRNPNGIKTRGGKNIDDVTPGGQSLPTNLTKTAESSVVLPVNLEKTELALTKMTETSQSKDTVNNAGEAVTNKEVGSSRNLQNKNADKAVSSQKNAACGKVGARRKSQAPKSRPVATSKITDSAV